MLSRSGGAIFERQIFIRKKEIESRGWRLEEEEKVNTKIWALL